MGSITLAEVAERTPTLAIACNRCDKASKYRLDTLIVRHGGAFGIPGLLVLLSADCPKRGVFNFYGQCGINCPDLPALFLTQRG